MPGEAMRNNLGEWQNPPIVQDRVIAYMDSIGAPMLLHEIYHPLRLPKEAVNRVLGRLHAKGVVTRYKIPVQGHRPDRWRGVAVHGAATRQCFLYSFAEDAGE
jgi:predicted ArsR family transcriptional regulator